MKFLIKSIECVQNLPPKVFGLFTRKKLRVLCIYRPNCQPKPQVYLSKFFPRTLSRVYRLLYTFEKTWPWGKCYMGMAAEHTLRQRFTWERFPGPRLRKDWRERRFHPSNTSVKLWSGFCTLLFIYEKIPRHFQTSFRDSTPYQSNIFVVIDFFLPFLQISRGPISPELKSSTRFT